jgi:membrane protein
MSDRDHPITPPPRPRTPESPSPTTDQTSGPGEDTPSAARPDGPTDLSGRSWRQLLIRTGRQFNDDNLTTWAAALTYYGIQSLFPGLLVLVALLKLTGRDTTRTVLNSLSSVAPGPTHDILTTALTNLQKGNPSAAGVLAIVGIAGALWSSSSYIGSFMRASNAIYDVPEGRPLWKKLPIRLGITVVAGVIVTASAIAVVFTGSLAQHAGKLLHIGSGAVLAWDIAKWPVLAVLISLLFSLLYWASPNAKQDGFRWISPGSILAVVIWIAASAGFGLYVANFGSYNKTYGTLAAVIVFLVWMWLSNLAILIGAEFDAELQRARAIEGGLPVDEEPYMPLRDTPIAGRGESQGL